VCGPDVSEARRLEVLTDENARPAEKLLAEGMLDNAMSKDLNQKKAATEGDAGS